MGAATQRTYTEAEKLPIMIAAVETDAKRAAELFDVPATTIYTWLNEHGGIVSVRTALKERADASMLTAREAVTKQIVERAAALPDSELAETFRAMLREAQPIQGNAQATAQAGVIVVQLRDGELLELADPDAQTGDHASAPGA